MKKHNGIRSSMDFFSEVQRTRFDENFDDRQIRNDIDRIPLEQVPLGGIGGQFRVIEDRFDYYQLYDEVFPNDRNMSAHVLLDSQNTLWMSDHPQERMMMAANAEQAAGHTLIGGLGLGIFPQYAQAGCLGRALRITIVERSPVVIQLVSPVLEKHLKVPFTIIQDDIDHFLKNEKQKFDTIFLDTWETLEPRQLFAIHELISRSMTHLTCTGRLLLWGYRWMMELLNHSLTEFMSFSRTRRIEILQSFQGSDFLNYRLLRNIEGYYGGYSRENRAGMRYPYKGIDLKRSIFRHDRFL